MNRSNKPSLFFQSTTVAIFNTDVFKKMFIFENARKSPKNFGILEIPENFVTTKLLMLYENTFD